MTTFKADDYCFNEHGEQAQYVAPAGSGHVVCYMYEHGDEETLGEPTYVERVFAKAPTVRRAQEVEELEKKAATLRKEIELLRKANAIEAAAIADRQVNLKKWDGLATLEAFLENKITHFVITDGRNVPQIDTFENALAYKDDDDRRYGTAQRPHKMRLLSLFGKSNGDLGWEIHKYREWSASCGVEVIPCLSYEAARDLFQNEWLAAIEKFRANPNANSFKDWTDAGAKHGLAFPPDLLARQREGKRVSLLSDVATKRAALVEVEKELAALDMAEPCHAAP